MLIDVALWKELGSPNFSGHSCKVTNIRYEPEWLGQTRPASFTKGEGSTYASDHCSMNGAQLVAAQLERFGHVTNISNAVLDEQFFFDERYAYSHLLSLTKFEHLRRAPAEPRNAV